MTSRWARVARGSLVAAVALFAAAFSHAIAGGAAPGPAGLAIAAAFALLASIAVVGRRLTLPGITVAVVVSQAFFHLVFSLGGPSAVVLTQAAHHGAITTTVSGAGAHPGHSGGWMLVAHAVAALVTIAFLHRGEREVWRVAAAASRQLAAVLQGRAVRLPVVPAGVAVRVPAVSRRLFRDDLGVVLSALRHRGPPARILTL
jgi:hypothetical protein